MYGMETGLIIPKLAVKILVLPKGWICLVKVLFLKKSRSLTSYLVDPASSHMLVSKIKPCMSKFKRFKQRDCGRLIISVIVYLMVDCYKDNRSNSRANTCTSKQFSVCTY